VVELGLYDSTARIRKSLSEQGLEPDTDAWNQAVQQELDRQRTAMEPRLYPDVPPHRYICFYPMDRKRGEDKNWYSVPFGDRQRMMHDHGMIGRKYAGAVKQVISGSIGLDDWEWGVDLWSEDPLWFKKLIYEMRFDEVSAIYALFGQFFVGIRVKATELPGVLGGRLPGKV
jgi:chlorite dismutase